MALCPCYDLNNAIQSPHPAGVWSLKEGGYLGDPKTINNNPCIEFDDIPIGTTTVFQYCRPSNFEGFPDICVDVPLTNSDIGDIGTSTTIELLTCNEPVTICDLLGASPGPDACCRIEGDTNSPLFSQSGDCCTATIDPFQVQAEPLTFNLILTIAGNATCCIQQESTLIVTVKNPVVINPVPTYRCN